MKKVITYGTYDLFHQGHYNLLKRAKDLGDYLIVGVTTDNFDLERGKMNTCNNVMERIEAVKATGLADQIVIEEYRGQKIDDIQKYVVDICARIHGAQAFDCGVVHIRSAAHCDVFDKR